MLKFHLYAELIQSALDEQELRPQAFHVEYVLGLEGHDIIVQLFELAPADAEAARFEHQSFNARVGCGFTEQAPRLHHRERLLLPQEGQRQLHRGLFRQLTFEMQNHGRSVGDLHPAFAEAHGGENQDHDHQARENKSDDESECEPLHDALFTAQDLLETPVYFL